MDVNEIKTNLFNFFKNQNTLTFILVCVAIVGVYFAYAYLVKQATEPVSVAYCTKTLKEKEEITEENVSTVQVMGNFVTKSGDTLITNKGRVFEKYVKDGYIIPENSFFYSDSLTDGSEANKSYYEDIPDNYTVFALSVDFHSTYGSSIMPGNMIDLYFKADTTSGDKDDKPKLIYGIFIESIEVLEVLDEKGYDVFTDTESGEKYEPVSLMFAVPDEYYELLSEAVKLGYEIIPVPRNSAYSQNVKETTIVSESIKEFIQSGTVTYE